MVVGITISVFVCIVFIDFIPRRKDRKTKETVFYGAVLAICFFVVMLYNFGVTLPNPTEAIESIVKTIVPIK